MRNSKTSLKSSTHEGYGNVTYSNDIVDLDQLDNHPLSSKNYSTCKKLSLILLAFSCILIFAVHKFRHHSTLPVAARTNDAIELDKVAKLSSSSSNISSHASPSIPLCSASGVGSSYKNGMLLFGGRTVVDGKQLFLDMVMEYSPSTSTWTVYDEGNAYNNSVVVSNRRLVSNSKTEPNGVIKANGVVNNGTGSAVYYMYGGSLGFSPDSDDSSMWKFDLTTKKWQKSIISDAEHAPGVRGHCMVSYKNLLILFGGKGSDAHDRNWIWYYDVTKPEDGWTEFDVKTYFNPGVRHAATCAMVNIYGEYVFAIFGGRSGDAAINGGKMYYYNDLWIFKLKSAVWNRIYTGENAPGYYVPYGVAHLTSANLDDDQVFVVIGGHTAESASNQVAAFDFRKFRWRKLSDLPGQRFEHVSCEYSGGILVFGGQLNLPSNEPQNDVDVIYNDLLRYDEASDSWQVLESNNCALAEKEWGYR